MAITGTIPLSKVQGDLETTQGTAIAATRILPILSGDLNQHMETSRPVEQRASLIRHYRSPIQTRRWCEVSMEVAPTFEDFIWYAQLALKGHATAGTALAPSVVNATVDRYTFTPAAATGVTQSATLQLGNDTQAWAMTHSIINRLEFGWELGGPATMSIDWMGARAVTTTYTASLSAVTGEDINGSLARAYIDTTTIASTLVTTVQSMRFSIDNHLAFYWAPNGDIFPVDFYHEEPRTIHMEATLAYLNNTEYATLLAKTQRKIRTTIEGTNIASSSPATNKSLKLDWYGYWDEAPWGSQGGLVTQTFSGDAVYDATATHDWQVNIDCDEATIV